ncbi:hypothetical protein V6N11_013120 [Hibiscus sabdariffa]|uniref:Uncharacterized protein n=2 Tax=Hibiscus sabdariffa TaxID=183260 RepID=A0ABR2B5U5_9ROSI
MAKPWVEFSKHQEGQAKAQYGDDSFSVASSNSSKKPLPSSSVIHQEVEDDVINAILLGKVMNDCHVVENCLGRNLGEEDLMGKGLKESSFSEPNVEKNQFTIEKSETVGGRLKSWTVRS